MSIGSLGPFLSLPVFARLAFARNFSFTPSPPRSLFIGYHHMPSMIKIANKALQRGRVLAFYRLAPCLTLLLCGFYGDLKRARTV